MVICPVCSEEMRSRTGVFVHDFNRNGISYTVKTVQHDGLYHITITNNVTGKEINPFNTDMIDVADSYMRKIVDGYSGEELP